MDFSAFFAGIATRYFSVMLASAWQRMCLIECWC
jgi:hypothetical protein